MTIVRYLNKKYYYYYYYYYYVDRLKQNLEWAFEKAQENIQ